MADLRQTLLRLQKQNYLRKLREVNRTLEAAPHVARYGSRYHQALRTYREVVDPETLLRQVLRADIVFQGDYHTLRHSQKAILTLLEKVAPQRDIVLCLEMFHSADQKHVDAYQAGTIDEKTLHRRIRYAKTWAYNWNPWKSILEFCRRAELPVLGLNCVPQTPDNSLQERDEHAAQIVGRAHLANPGKLIWVVDGDYHMAPGHLPGEVKNRLMPLGVSPETVTLYQNVESLFWKMAAEGHEEAGVLRIQDDSFCLMNTLPSTKLQSYLDWLEAAEEGHFQVKGHWAELSGENYYHQVRAIARDLDALFDFGLTEEPFERLTVYSSRNLHFVEVLDRHPVVRREWRRIEEKIRRGEGFLLEIEEPGKAPEYVIYLQDASINQAAEETTHFLNAVLRGGGGAATGSAMDRFYREAMTEALGFFGSKAINEKRRVVSDWSLRFFLGSVRKQKITQRDKDKTVQVAQLLLAHHQWERRGAGEQAYRNRFEQEVYRARSNLPHVLATQLGYMLGNRMYYAVKKGYLPLAQVRQFFFNSWSEPGSAFRAYLDTSERLARLRMRKGPHALEPWGEHAGKPAQA